MARQPGIRSRLLGARRRRLDHHGSGRPREAHRNQYSGCPGSPHPRAGRTRTRNLPRLAGRCAAPVGVARCRPASLRAARHWRGAGSIPPPTPAHPVDHHPSLHPGGHDLAGHSHAPPPRRYAMKQSVQIVGRITAGVVLLGAVGVAAWWDHSADAEPLLTGAEGPVSQHVEIADARTLLACPGQPVLASLGEDAPTQDADGADEPPVGTYDPEYAPDAGNATSLINAISIGTAQSAPATTILDSRSLREEQPETETVELGGSGAVHNGRITSEGPVSFIATARPDSDQNPLVTGVRFGSATEGDLRGIAATPCIPIAAEQWLIGGQTEAGSSAKLELMNQIGRASCRETGWIGGGDRATETR